jgi:hypothetical protein
VCAYAANLCYGFPLTEIDILATRLHSQSLVFLSDEPAKYIGGAGPQRNNDVAAILEFNDAHIASYAFAKIDCKRAYTLHPTLGKAMCDRNTQHIVHNLSLPHIANKTLVFIPVFIFSCRWVLFYVNFVDGTVSVLDPFLEHPDYDAIRRVNDVTNSNLPKTGHPTHQTTANDERNPMVPQSHRFVDPI